MVTLHPLFVVAGVGGGTGTGAAAARAFSRAGYSVALIARGKESLERLAADLKSAGGNAAPFPIASYSVDDLKSAFTSIAQKFPASQYALRAALYNAGSGVWKPFLSTTVDDLQASLQTNVVGAFAFAQEVIPVMKANENHPERGRGTLIFTGATASIRGNVTTSAFSISKHGVRALSQSLAKEFGKEDIHVAHAIIDGGIYTQNNPDRKLEVGLKPESIAQSYLWLANQERSAWTWELDLRPSHEKW
ncbi:NAD(P)-binding protein [Fistulina hepatica ATCC 64428]|uniref:NAD(P)-binding protein n=1 Tax=Fistulina hepatica ATCC 64428 TaxID=1128425 RepID=A0A0D7AH33_9AGAR|nr:NAD(P)-binding protein [Fistulina hepatica ATCC 64428]